MYTYMYIYMYVQKDKRKQERARKRGTHQQHGDTPKRFTGPGVRYINIYKYMYIYVYMCLYMSVTVLWPDLQALYDIKTR